MRTTKNSGFEWIGEIPTSWELYKGKYMFTQRNLRGNTIELQLLSPTQKYGVVPQSVYEDRSGMNAVKLNENANLSALKTIHKGDFCISLRSFQGGFEYSEYEGVVSPAYQVFYPVVKVARGYYKYLFKDSGFIEKMNSYTMTLRDGKNISFADFGNTYIPCPPVDEQQHIADFLDAKCAEIDALTADIQSQIDTLEQYKRSVITETVTKGLNPDAETKDSGIDGAGVTPSHWKTTRLCYECYIRARLGWRGLKADEYVDEGYAFISAFNIQNGKLVWTPLNYITKERFDESPEIKLHTGDLLLVKDGAGVGKCARVDELPMGGTAPNSSIAVITPSEKQDYRYVCYYLQSSVFNNFVLLLYNGMGVPHLTQEIMSKIKILIPPLKEQMAISNYLDAKCAEIDAIVETKKQQLSTLDEYKKSLIFEYVTGKKEV